MRHVLTTLPQAFNITANYRDGTGGSADVPRTDAAHADADVHARNDVAVHAGMVFGAVPSFHPDRCN
jgi:hypothetical protein